MNSPSLPPLPEPQKVCWIGHTLFDADQMRAFYAAGAAAEREALRVMLADDAAAMTYQTLGQYRTSLLATIRSRGKP